MDTHRLTTLPSGVRVVTEAMPGMRSAALGLWIDVGSRDETPEQGGITHFIEHLLFKGTATRTALEIAETFDGLAGELNAFTTKDSTCVYTRVLDEHASEALDVMCDMLSSPIWAELEPEREVVLEEIAMIDDDPADLVHDLAARCVFGQHPLGRPIIGTVETVASFEREHVGAFHSARYGSRSVVLAAAGSVDHDAICAHAERALQLGDAPLATRGPVSELRPRHAFFRKETEQAHVCVGGPGIGRGDDRRFALALLDHVLGSAASSRLMQEIREKRGLAYSVYSYTSQYAGSGQVGISFGTRNENVGTCLTIAREQLDDLAGSGPRVDELARAKQSLKGRMLLSLEQTSSRMSRLGRSVLADDEILSLDELGERIDGVTAADVAALAAELFAEDRLSIAAIGDDPSVLTIDAELVEAIA